MKQNSNRRDFIKTSSALFAGALIAKGFDFKEEKLRLSFSTLGCPDWPFDKIVAFAAANGYCALELRGILKEMDLTKCKEFNSSENIASTLKLMHENDLKFIDLGSSAEMHHSDPSERKNNMDEAKRFIDLAQQLNCPYIRVFPNKLPKETRDATVELIIQGLKEAGEYAKATNVTVLMETHGEVTDTTLIKHIMEQVNDPKVGLVWDVSNMWTVTKERPAKVYDVLKQYIHHTHIKDAKLVDNTPHYVLMGQGDVPIFEAIDILRKNNYQGYYSFEWEKLWHPEILAPEVAIADYPKAMHAHFK